MQIERREEEKRPARNRYTVLRFRPPSSTPAPGALDPTRTDPPLLLNIPSEFS